MELFKPDAGLFVWMLIAFSIVFFILAKFAWPVILKSIKERSDHIASSLLAAEEAQKKIDNLQLEGETIINQAKEEQLKILQEGRHLKNKLLNEAKDNAKNEATKVLEDAHKAIAKEREETLRDAEKRAITLSISIAEKILRKNLDNLDEQHALAQKLVDDVELSN